MVWRGVACGVMACGVWRGEVCGAGVCVWCVVGWCGGGVVLVVVWWWRTGVYSTHVSPYVLTARANELKRLAPVC